MPYRPAETSQELLKEYIDGLFVGSVSAFAMDTPPAGWLACNGQAISRVEYARLFNRIGTTFGAGGADGTTFHVPDLRAEFVRGWGAASGRALGSHEPDQMQSHTHVDGGHVHSGQTSITGGHTHRLQHIVQDTGGAYGLNIFSGPHLGISWPGHNGMPHPSSDAGGDHGHTISIQTGHAQLSDPAASSAGPVRHGTETRPRNVALLYCIKY